MKKFGWEVGLFLLPLQNGNFKFIFMTIEPISGNLEIVISDFPFMVKTDVTRLLSRIANDIQDLSGIKPRIMNVITKSNNDFPDTVLRYYPDFGCMLNVIQLSLTRYDSLVQWAFQFGHEYVHALISSESLNTVPRYEMWFEELLCNAMGVYMTVARFGPSVSLSAAVPDTNALELSNSVIQAIRQQTGLHPLLSRIRHGGNPSFYTATWVPCILGLFSENPCLWKSLKTYSRTRPDADIYEIFDVLSCGADDSYAESLKKLKQLLFP